jgi:protoheme IX farnesyltransferase
LFKSDDYERAGVPMMPNVAGEASTRRQIFVYSLLLAVSGVLPSVFGYSSWAYGLAAALLGAGFVRYAWSVLTMAPADAGMKPAKALFGYSLLYLFAIFTLVLADHIAMRMLG